MFDVLVSILVTFFSNILLLDQCGTKYIFLCFFNFFLPLENGAAVIGCSQWNVPGS